MDVTIVATELPLPRETRYQLSSEVVRKTLDHLRGYGQRGLEAVGYWLGSYTGRVAQVRQLWIPHFDATGVSYDVSPLEMLRLKRELDQYRYVLLAQVHSHPGEAFHSSRDDRLAASPWPGFVSVVVPNGGRIMDPFVEAVEIFEHVGSGSWRHLEEQEKRSRFVVS
ncbi:MAG: Mov34/MPN/PAD-1 family protein [Acidobacteria bacterium]|nr:Mov34/MPN/PAD-1 family protein [Acidobacteriota bacterium]